jgi:hypothetical protein
MFTAPLSSTPTSTFPSLLRLGSSPQPVSSFLLLLLLLLLSPTFEQRQRSNVIQVLLQKAPQPHHEVSGEEHAQHYFCPVTPVMLLECPCIGTVWLLMQVYFSFLSPALPTFMNLPP